MQVDDATWAKLEKWSWGSVVRAVFGQAVATAVAGAFLFR